MGKVSPGNLTDLESTAVTQTGGDSMSDLPGVVGMTEQKDEELK